LDVILESTQGGELTKSENRFATSTNGSKRRLDTNNGAVQGLELFPAEWREVSERGIGALANLSRMP